jgi:hypothetical protein
VLVVPDPKQCSGMLVDPSKIVQAMQDGPRGKERFLYNTKVDIHMTASMAIEELKHFFNHEGAAARRLLMVFWSGHGREESGDWICADPDRRSKDKVAAVNGRATASDPRVLDLTFDDMQAAWEGSEAQRNGAMLCITMDSCYSGHWAEKAAQKGLLDIMVQAASGPLAPSLDCDKGGVFYNIWTEYQLGKKTHAEALHAIKQSFVKDLPGGTGKKVKASPSDGASSLQMQKRVDPQLLQKLQEDMQQLEEDMAQFKKDVASHQKKCGHPVFYGQAFRKSCVKDRIVRVSMLEDKAANLLRVGQEVRHKGRPAFVYTLPKNVVRNELVSKAVSELVFELQYPDGTTAQVPITDFEVANLFVGISSNSGVSEEFFGQLQAVKPQGFIKGQLLKERGCTPIRTATVVVPANSHGMVLVQWAASGEISTERASRFERGQQRDAKEHLALLNANAVDVWGDRTSSTNLFFTARTLKTGQLCGSSNTTSPSKSEGQRVKADRGTGSTACGNTAKVPAHRESTPAPAPAPREVVAATVWECWVDGPTSTLERDRRWAAYPPAISAQLEAAQIAGEASVTFEHRGSSMVVEFGSSMHQVNTATQFKRKVRRRS